MHLARASLCTFTGEGVASAAGTRGRVALLAACGDRRGNMQGSKPAPPLPYRAGPAAQPAGLRHRHMRCRLRPYRRPAPPGRQRCPVPQQRSRLPPRAAAAAAPVAAPAAGRPCDEARQGALQQAYTMSHVRGCSLAHQLRYTDGKHTIQNDNVPREQRSVDRCICVTAYLRCRVPEVRRCAASIAVSSRDRCAAAPGWPACR